jgi:hypothetical protein
MHGNVPYFDGQVKVDADQEPTDPKVWTPNSLKVDEDGTPVKEALFSNHNADLLLECEGQSLVGRSELDRGLAHKIDVILPLMLDNHRLLYTGGSGPGGGISEAPINGVAHGRVNASWTPVLKITGDILDGGNF